MAQTRRKSDADCREGAVRLVRKTGQPIAQDGPGPGDRRDARPGTGPTRKALAACQAAVSCR